MREQIISILVAVIIFFFMVYLLSLGVDLSLLTTELAVGLFFAAIGILWWGLRSDVERLIKKKPDIRPDKGELDPRFKHVEARLFYPRKHRWEKMRVLRKHWWEIRKQSPSHHRLVLIKDLKKAYYVGTYAWNLIAEGKIEWFSENDQDIEEWCKKEDYTLVKENASEDNLLEPFFEAEINDKKAEYKQGEIVRFKTRYRGKLTDGFFDNEIDSPQGTVFSDGDPRKWSRAPDTLEDMFPNTKGKLNGYINQPPSEWSWGIPDDAPLGKYQIYMRVYNHLGINNRPVIDEKEEIITVIPRSGKLEKQIVSAMPVGDLTPKYNEEQLQYRSQLKDEIIQVRQELENIERPRDIPFIIWLHDPEQKRKLIGNDREYELIQKFYTAMQNRYDHQKSMKHPDGEFAQLNTKCIEAYNAVMKEVTWAKEKPDLRQTRTELLKALYLFLEHWETHKKLIESGSLKPPQNGEIKHFSDLIKSAVTSARILNLGRINAIIPQIEAVSDDMSILGIDVFQYSDSIIARFRLEKAIQDLISRGDTIHKELERVIPIVEQTFR